jgi:hypothetical protein
MTLSAALQGCRAAAGRPDHLRQGSGGPPKRYAKAEGLRYESGRFRNDGVMV